jgi:2-polyprenyl-3-methyl-5-hydroxy-6-metoxy-1,4-benzoquinol methylase
MDERSRERMRAHYEIEKEIASRLRAAPRHERAQLYARLYDELYARVPDHPQLHVKSSAVESRREVAWQIQILSRFLSPSTRFLEIGAGACALSLAVASRVQHVTAIDVSDAISRQESVPANFRLVLSDTLAAVVPAGSIDVAYSNQMIEHLHPEDAVTHVRDVHEVLAPGGVYVCITPNRVTGPHDVSAGFDPVATGLHLREYTAAELVELLRQAGFTRVAAVVGPPGFSRLVPVGCVATFERLVGLLPRSARAALERVRPVRTLLRVCVAAWK